MKPSPFRYVRPASVEEAVAVLDEHADDASLLAGGQSLIPMMSFRLAKPEVLIDLNRVRELDYRRRDGAALHVGALTRHRQLEHLASTPEGQGYGLIGKAAAHIGHHPIRNLGTTGGSIAHADPSAELPLLAVALDADVIARSVRGRRSIAAVDFFRGAMLNGLRDGEMVEEVRFPWAPEAWAFDEVSRREGDFAIVAVAVAVRRAAAGDVQARIALGGVGPAPVRPGTAETLLTAQWPGEVSLDELAEAAMGEIDPPSDVHADAWYRRHLVGVLVRRCVGAALRMAGGR